MAPAFFAPSVRFREGHAALYDFVHGVTVALWNTRWHVAGYVAALPDASRDDLEARFVSGSGIRGVNVRRTFIEQTWEAHVEELARIALTNTIALYEAWAVDIAREFGVLQRASELQFPSRGVGGRRKRGIREVLSDMTNAISPAMDAEVAAVLRKQRSYHEPQLDAQLLVYRYFKELRNASVHEAGRATPALTAAYGHISELTARDVAAKQLPEHHAPVAGSITKLSLRGVIGFGGIVYSMVTTMDAELAATTVAEDELVTRFGRMYNGRTLPASAADRSTRLRGLIAKCGLPRLEAVAQLDERLAARGLIGAAVAGAESAAIRRSRSRAHARPTGPVADRVSRNLNLPQTLSG